MWITLSILPPPTKWYFAYLFNCLFVFYATATVYPSFRTLTYPLVYAFIYLLFCLSDHQLCLLTNPFANVSLTYHQSICLHGQPQTCLLIRGFSLFFFKRANLSDTLYFGGGGCEWVALSGPHSGSEPQNVVRRTKYFRNYSGPRTS